MMDSMGEDATDEMTAKGVVLQGCACCALRIHVTATVARDELRPETLITETCSQLDMPAESWCVDQPY